MKNFLLNNSNNEIIPDKNFLDYGIICDGTKEVSYLGWLMTSESASQYFLEAKISSYKLYDKSLSLIPKMDCWVMRYV